MTVNDWPKYQMLCTKSILYQGSCPQIFDLRHVECSPSILLCFLLCMCMCIYISIYINIYILIYGLCFMFHCIYKHNYNIARLYIVFWRDIFYSWKQMYQINISLNTPFCVEFTCFLFLPPCKDSLFRQSSNSQLWTWKWNHFQLVKSLVSYGEFYNSINMH